MLTPFSMFRAVLWNKICPHKARKRWLNFHFISKLKMRSWTSGRLIGKPNNEWLYSLWFYAKLVVHHFLDCRFHCTIILLINSTDLWISPQNLFFSSFHLLLNHTVIHLKAFLIALFSNFPHLIYQHVLSALHPNMSLFHLLLCVSTGTIWVQKHCLLFPTTVAS